MTNQMGGGGGGGFLVSNYCDHSANYRHSLEQRSALWEFLQQSRPTAVLCFNPFLSIKLQAPVICLTSVIIREKCCVRKTTCCLVTAAPP